MTPLLRVDGVGKTYSVRRGVLRGASGRLTAVDDVSFQLDEGSTFGLLGESGSGKSTLGRLILGIEPPSFGEIRYAGRDVAEWARNEPRSWSREVQPVFQNPYSALAPRMKIGRALEEPYRIHRVKSDAVELRTTVDLLRQVGLPPRVAQRYVHQLSGGQRQRVVIARALALDPRLVVCDEPVSALDVSVQGHILQLLKRLQAYRGLAYVFVSHDLAVVRFMADEIGVMYLGSIVERGEAGEIYRDSRHPYSRALVAAVPSLHGSRRDRLAVPRALSERPSPTSLPRGCKYHTRCPLATDRCVEERPALRSIERGHWAACHYAEEVPELMKRAAAATTR